MRKIILYIATSINGYIAKADGSVDWLEEIPQPANEDYGYEQFMESIDTTIQGRATYNQIINWGIEFPYKKTMNYVLTTDNSLQNNEDVTFINSNHVEFINDLKQKPGKDIWLIGGGQINGFLLENNLIDEVQQFLMPIIIADGINLFGTYDGVTKLKVINNKVYSSGVVKYHYRAK